MKKCHDIENLLPLYPEGILSDTEKRAVEEHLADCAECRKELAYLQKANHLVNQLPQVAEPPWFQQKIMARVHEEADKKSFVQKWFYPLRIKIPVQIMATIVIAILAVYIYRSGDEQVKEILPGAQQPAIEIQKEQAPAPKPQVGDQAVPMAPRKKSAFRKDVKHDNQVTSNIAAGGNVQKSEMAPESKSDRAYETDATREKGLAESKDKAYGALQDKQNETKSVKAQLADQEKIAQDRLSIGMSKKKESYKMAAPAAPRSMAAAVAPPQARVLVRVDDFNDAVSEVEKVLAKYDARIMTKQLTEGKVVIRAEVAGGNWREVITKLKAIGQVEEKGPPADIGERVIHVMIEIAGR